MLPRFQLSWKTEWKAFFRWESKETVPQSEDQLAVKADWVWHLQHSLYVMCDLSAEVFPLADVFLQPEQNFTFRFYRKAYKQPPRKMDNLLMPCLFLR